MNHQQTNKIATEGKQWLFKGEVVKLERWIWVVKYNDNTEIHQFDKDGNFHQIGEVDQSKVALFIFYKPSEPNKRIDIVMPAKGKLIHKYRNYVLNVGTPNEKKIRLYMFGYKNGKAMHINFILPDDRITQSTTDKIKLSNQC